MYVLSVETTFVRIANRGPLRQAQGDNESVCVFASNYNNFRNPACHFERSEKSPVRITNHMRIYESVCVIVVVISNTVRNLIPCHSTEISPFSRNDIMIPVSLRPYKNRHIP